MTDIYTFTKKMEAKHPKIFSGRYGGITVGEGWGAIIEKLADKIQAYLDTNPLVEQVKVTQVKEKFGTLRFYYDGGDDAVYAMVRDAENESSRTCETCGDHGELRTGGWLKTLCDRHHQERQSPRG